MNIFQIWDSIGRITPFAVRRDNWSERYYTIVEKVECEALPYGKAFGYPTDNGTYSTHFEYDKNWRKEKLIPCCGCYQWTLVEEVDLTSYKEGVKATVKSVKGAYVLNSRFYFGKFSGETVEEAFNHTPSYIQWLMINHKDFYLEPATLDYLHALKADFRFNDESLRANASKVNKKLEKAE